ncbi:mannosyltransferase [Flavobacteriaceae bacterium TP-CH-4]|uniref:Mannosyltransferase n=1 Tax=Pelagihabitans pacificus TaxID=2696054 RepID=A0A967AVE6_9FLAO|nr:mannosyltransferase [Pelagihabitans pacificus]NHF60684.1 mannosyltransferase [Pelagihabitans pacificus]
MPSQLVTYWKLHRTSILLALLAGLFYYTFAYQLVRTDFIKLLTLFTALFFLCFKLIQFEKWNFKFLLAVGILFRLVFLVAEPNLSQDFYRFIWDGELVRLGLNPYLHLPDTLIQQADLAIANAQILYEGMGGLSSRHFSNYPPLNQLIFGLVALLGGKSVFGSIIAMRSVIILADVGLFYFGRKLLRNLNKSPHLIFWYFLNPLIIIELTGNLHFEGVMLFFFVWALYLLSIKKWFPAAVIYAFSICVKLVPLLFLPLFLKYFGFKKSILFYVVVGVTCSLLILPFYSSDFIDNYSKTVGLWFSNFEFNAGLYNGIKKLAVQFNAKPWELIKTYGRITPWLTIAVALLLTFFRNNQKLGVLMGSMLWLLSFYYFSSSTVHPWYLIFLVTLCIFTEYRFAILWSAVVVLSYFAYSNGDFKENLGLLAIEYFAVYVFLGYEIITRQGKKMLFRKK